MYGMLPLTELEKKKKVNSSQLAILHKSLIRNNKQEKKEKESFMFRISSVLHLMFKHREKQLFTQARTPQS